MNRSYPENITVNLLTSQMEGRDRIGRVKEILKSILFGATLFDMTQDALRMKWYTEQSLMLVSIGDMLGLPIVSYYRLRLLPYWIHKIQIWKTAVLKEKDITEKILS